MAGKIEKYLLIYFDSITENAACYMLCFFLYTLHAMYMLCSDLSIKSDQLKNKMKLKLSIKQRPSLNSPCRLLHLGKKWHTNKHPVNNSDISSKANPVFSVNLWLIFSSLWKPNQFILCCSHPVCSGHLVTVLHSSSLPHVGTNTCTYKHRFLVSAQPYTGITKFRNENWFACFHYILHVV